MLPQKTKESKIPQTDVRGTIRDFILPIVEFLGILVPGVIFIFSFIPAAIIPLANLLDVLEQGAAQDILVSKDLLAHLISPGFGTLFILTVFSYVVGHLFFRQDPKYQMNTAFRELRRQSRKRGRCDSARKKKNSIRITIEKTNTI
jgi:hypothetical protein